jgi:hypothetical protein
VSDIARDEHLRTALRHAPDAALAAPEAVSAQIVAAANRAADEPAPVVPGRRRWWRLPVWRLGPSSALASLMLAGVLGLLWYEAPPGPARTDENMQAPAAPPAGVSHAPAAAVSEAPAAAKSKAPAAAKTEAHAPAPGAVLPALAPEAVEAARSSRPARALRESPPPHPGTAPPASPEAVAAAVPQAAAPPAPLRQVPALDAAEPTAAAAAADATAPTAAEAAADGAEPTAATAAAARAGAAEASASSATPPAALSRRTLPARTPAQAEDLAAPPAAPGPAWADVLRQPIGGAEAESGAAATAWLQELDRQTLGPWRAAPDTVPPTEPPDFVLSRGAMTAGRLWLRAGQVLWCNAAGSCQQAPLQAGAEAVLRQRLPRPR